MEKSAKSMIRRSAAGLGIATVLFGITPLVTPQWFARCFGFKTPDAGTASMMRSLGVRDIVMGLGLWSAATHNGNYTPWLLARLLTDAGDGAAIAVAVARGERDRRFWALGVLAIGAAIGDALLYGAAKNPDE